MTKPQQNRPKWLILVKIIRKIHLLLYIFYIFAMTN